MVRISKVPGAVVQRLMGFRCLRWLFVSYLYRKPIAHSEATIAFMRNSDKLDESYWIGKLRQFAHVVDKGLHRGDFTKGHGITGYRAAKGALSNLQSHEGLRDPLVQWATERVCLYEQLQNGQETRIEADYVASKCRHEDLVDTIRTRRSIRRFIKRPVEDAVVEKIADVLDWAPTSCHRQPGRVYASNNPDIVRQCVDLHIGAGCFTDIHVPLFMTFCADSRLYRMPDELAIPYIDVSLGVQNCLLAAHALGLSLTPLIWSYQGEWQEHELRKIFSIPEHYQIILSAVGGYPDGGSQVPPRKRRELFIIN